MLQKDLAPGIYSKCILNVKGIDIANMRLEIGRGCVILGLRPHLFVEDIDTLWNLFVSYWVLFWTSM